MTRFGSVVVAAVLAAATTVLPGATLAPAAAAACTDAGGITVVADPGSLPGSLSQTCVSSGGDDAAALFGQAQHQLQRVQRFPAAVCKVDGEPASSSCVNMPPTNAYWGLFWSNGTSGSWVYASESVDSLDIPAGGSVALAWQGSSSRRNPAVPPPDHSGSAPEEPGDSGGTRGGTGGGNGGGSTGDGAGSGSPSSSPSASEPPTGHASGAADGKRAEQRDRDRGSDEPARERPRDRVSESPDPTGDATVLPDAAVADEAAAASEPAVDGGLPLWLVGLAAGCLLAVGAAVAVVRRNAARNA